MEEIEITSWLTLDAIKNEATIIEVLGDFLAGHCTAVFCSIEDDFLELCYSDSISNFLRRFDDKEELELALEKRKDEFGEAEFEEEIEIEEDFDSTFNDDNEDDFTEDSDNF
ncbi:MAG: hypothetical protein MUP98_04685 [Candidatus Aminicenantes bacterium]|nr:hypothetical protein [Candidatus Aminicenantes bacterium]